MSAWPVRPPFSRRNSSAVITTTASRPWRVTRCGPSLRTRRTNSLKRALASCSSQWPDVCKVRDRRRRLPGLPGGGFIILVMVTILSPNATMFHGAMWRIRAARVAEQKGIIYFPLPFLMNSSARERTIARRVSSAARTGEVDGNDEIPRG
jgi:hypothetical protein